MFLKYLRPLFVLMCLLGGSGWIFLPLQLRQLPPAFAVSYRFLLAALTLLAVAKWLKYPFPQLTRVQILRLVVQGITFFGLNQMLCYEASYYIKTGLVALCVSLLIIPNAIIEYGIRRKPMKANVLLGIFCGVVGALFVFHEDLGTLSFGHQANIGLALALLSTIFSAFGTFLAAKNIEERIAPLWNTILAMSIGGVFSFLWAVFQYKTVMFDFSTSYMITLLYIAPLTNAAPFYFYFLLLETIGPAKSSYMWIMTLMVALMLSMLWEGLSWSIYSTLGCLLILFGGYITIPKTKIERF